ncbi:MAG: hypothetical protein ACRENK_09310 [Gemmatimonadaceae bacterium]
MRFRVLVGAAAGVAVFASVAAAQVCQGDLSFRGGSTHVGGTLGMSDHSTTFGAGLSAGHVMGWYGGGSVGMVNYDNTNGNSLALNGGVGYSMPLQHRSKWQMCPGATLSLNFGPSVNVGGASTHLSTQTLTMGVSTGTVVALTKTVNLIPFGSAAFGHTRLAAKLNGKTATGSDNYLLLGGGAGFQFSPSLVVRPALSLAAGADLIDDTVFSVGITFALPH